MIFAITKRSDIRHAMKNYVWYVYESQRYATQDNTLTPIGYREALDQATPEHERWRINTLAALIRTYVKEGKSMGEIQSEKYYKEAYRELTDVLEKHMMSLSALFQALRLAASLIEVG